MNFSEDKISTQNDIPVTLPPDKFSMDAVKCDVLETLIHVFARSQTNKSRVHWTYFDTAANKSNGSPNKNLHDSNITWKAIGSNDDYLKFDPYVVKNSYINRLEIFSVFTDGYVRHTWQEDKTEFSDKWEKLSRLSSKKYNSAPVVHEMPDNFFNGILHLFVRGEDNQLHHIKQTSCDKIKNPWGPCTWELGFSSLGGTLPANESSVNPLTVSKNIHRGIEVRMIVCPIENGALFSQQSNRCLPSEKQTAIFTRYGS